MGVFKTLAELMCDYADLREKEEQEARLAYQKRQEEKRKKKWEKEQAEHERWLAATEASYRNPDEWKVLPYGWSPFGLYL